MKAIRIPSILHEVFGEQQSVGTILVILAFGGCLTITVSLVFPDILHSLPLWRGILALLLIFDIFCGCIANFTRSTSNFYAARKKQRIVFIAIHVHILLVAVLLDTDMVYAVGIWAYTIAGAVIVNALIGKSSQHFIGGLLLSIGIGGTFLLSNIQPYMLLAGTLFMLKVLFSFAVDHYGGAEQRA